VCPDHAHRSLRFALGRRNTEAEVDYVVNQIARTIGKLRGSLVS
jgi:cysteine sulfinate desulfinase/cysteine desulfurase-like protein